MQTRPRQRNFWKQLRRSCQILGLGIFLVLFRLTDYTGTDTIPYAVNLLFRIDPLVGACVTLATKSFVVLLWPCLVLVVLTLVLGRFFCGWICPMGTLIDIAGRGFRPDQKFNSRPRVNLRFLKYGLLVLVLISSLFSIQLLGFFDPFSLLVRGMAFGIDPLFNFLITGVFDKIYLSGPAWLSDLTEPVYGMLKSFVLPHKQSFFYLSFLSFFLVAGIFALEIFGKRFWCKTLCPLGALLGLISKLSILKRRPVKACKGCRLCEKKCPVNAFEPIVSEPGPLESGALEPKSLKTNTAETLGRFMGEECTLCMDCIAYCPRGIAGFGFGLPDKPKSVDISRRQLLTAGVVGICLPGLSRTNALSKVADNELIRPPGALAEPDFLATCVRCGECMKVCITNGLQPIGFEKGLETMFTPKLVPRLGYCEFNCTLCSQVCPTHAIELLSKEKKNALVMGKAWFDKNRCLPYAENKSCIVCEEHCPVHDKAIQFDVVKILGAGGEINLLKQPRIIADRCIGCGICEYVCPVPGKAAIRVLGRDSRKNFSPGSGYP
ncbi:MAG: 4Fe-4S ferredoxin [Deltaproteobacteria bacterium]|nr:MAG: 4Fe-4S ferredoxin [Deltaproteobacteria bacterium]